MVLLNNNIKPELTEPIVKSFLSKTLQHCHAVKINYYNTVLNASMFFGFCTILGLFLLYKYKGKLTPVELAHKNMEKQKFLLDRIKNFQIAKRRAQQELITGLPHWENDIPST